jgi:hypothetical protein
MKRKQEDRKQYPMGFQFDAIAPGVESDIHVIPRAPFRGEQLAIPRSVANHFKLLDIKVGPTSQLAKFSPPKLKTLGVSYECRSTQQLDTAHPGMKITLRVRNIDTKPHDFLAVLYGAIEDE